jgi:hypothetical protein
LPSPSPSPSSLPNSSFAILFNSGSEESYLLRVFSLSSFFSFSLFIFSSSLTKSSISLLRYDSRAFEKE